MDAILQTTLSTQESMSAKISSKFKKLRLSMRRKVGKMKKKMTKEKKTVRKVSKILKKSIDRLELAVSVEVMMPYYHMLEVLFFCQYFIHLCVRNDARFAAGGNLIN
jgi:hypothetical protein